MTSARAAAALALLLAPPAFAFQAAPGTGACRGPGGVGDKVNNRYKYEIDETECRAYCAAEADCNGYAHSPAVNEGECLLHGPGLAGTCGDKAHVLRSKCEGAGAAWTGPGEGWTGESWHSTVVAGTTDEVSSSYVCYELDAEDHLGAVMPPEKPPHPGDVGLEGWGAPLSGACRGGADGTDKVNGLYATKDSQTQAQCAAKCLSLPACAGYHHGPYCSVFGAGAEASADPDGDAAVWFATAGNYTEITGTKANDQYLCFDKVPAAARAAAAAADEEENAASSVLGAAAALVVVLFSAAWAW